MEFFSTFIPPYPDAFDDFRQKANENFIWLSEILEQAASALQRPGLELLPKTPSQQKRKGRPPRAEIPRVSAINRKSRLRSDRRKSTTNGKLAKKAELTFLNGANVFVENEIGIVENVDEPRSTTKEKLAEKAELNVTNLFVENEIGVVETTEEPTHEKLAEKVDFNGTNLLAENTIGDENVEEPCCATTNMKLAKKAKLNGTDLSAEKEIGDVGNVEESCSSTKKAEISGTNLFAENKIVVENAELVVETKLHSSSKKVKNVAASIAAVVENIDEPRMTTRSKVRPKLEKEVVKKVTPKRTPVKSPSRIVPPSASKIRPMSTEKSSGSKLFSFGSTMKNYPSTFSRAPSSQYSSLYKMNTTPSANLPGNVSSFIKRNTPLKQSVKEYESNLKEKLQQQEARQKDASTKKQEMLQKKLEEQKKKREEREQKVAAHREQQKAHEEYNKRKLEEKQNAIMNLKDLEEQQKKKQKVQKNAEHESKKHQQEEERRRDEAKMRAKEQERLQAEREREEVERIRAAKEVELKKKQAAEAAAKTKKTSPKKQTGVTNTSAVSSNNRDSRLTFNVSSAAAAAPVSTTQIKQQSSLKEVESYEITPARKPKPSSDTNYDITDLNSEDDTDDEDAPRKKIPFWAQGAALKAAMVQQYYSGVDTDVLFFGALPLPDLQKLFNYHKKRFNHRTSSAIWKEASFQAFCDEDIRDK